MLGELLGLNPVGPHPPRGRSSPSEQAWARLTHDLPKPRLVASGEEVDGP